MKNVADQKIKLQQKKNRLAAEEIKLKLKERKMRTRHLIEVGGLIVKTELDHLPTNTLYGALLSLNSALQENPKIRDAWTKTGKEAFDIEAKTRTAIILKFSEKPDPELRQQIRDHKLKWNKFREEWYGEVNDLDALKLALKGTEHQIEVI